MANQMQSWVLLKLLTFLQVYLPINMSLESLVSSSIDFEEILVLSFPL